MVNPFKNFLERKAEIVQATNPDRIYVENIRAFFGIPRGLAHWLCEAAVREGLFTRKYAIWCPNDTCGRVIARFEQEDEIPEAIHCFQCEIDDLRSDFAKSDVHVEPIYSLVRRASSVSEAV